MDQPQGFDERLWQYNCTDACLTFDIWLKLQPTIDQLGVREPHDFQQRLFNAVLSTMIRGIKFDLENRFQFEKDLIREIASRNEWISSVLGHPINIRSPKQLAKLFYEDLRQKPIKNRKTRNVTTDDQALELLSVREPLLKPLITKIQELRSLGVFLSTFVRMPLDSDGRMRTSFNIAGTESFRFSSSENAFGTGGNLENIPSGGQDDDSELELPNIRKLFLPDPGYTLFDIDLSKADLRIVYWEADETEGKAMLREGLDPYVELAREFYKDRSITKNRPDGSPHPRYKQFKSFCHGSHYLASAHGLAQKLGLTIRETESTMKWYFERFPKIKLYQERIISEVTKRHWVQNIFGYKWRPLGRIDDGACRQAAAWIPQSSVALVINHGYVNLHERVPEAQVLLQVHDSLVLQIPSHLADLLKPRILSECSIPLSYSDPLVIPVGVKSSSVSWGDCR